MSDPQNPQPTPEPQPGDAVPPPPLPPPSPAPQPPPPIDYAGPVQPSATLSSNDRTMGMLCHLSAFAGHFIPFGNIIGPLVLWLIKKDESAFVDDQGKESLNFQITMTIAMLASAALICLIIGYFLFLAVWLTDVILVVVATVKANQGIRYRYPFCLRLVN